MRLQRTTGLEEWCSAMSGGYLGEARAALTSFGENIFRYENPPVQRKRSMIQNRSTAIVCASSTRWADLESLPVETTPKSREVQSLLMYTKISLQQYSIVRQSPPKLPPKNALKAPNRTCILTLDGPFVV